MWIFLAFCLINIVKCIVSCSQRLQVLRIMQVSVTECVAAVRQRGSVAQQPRKETHVGPALHRHWVTHGWLLRATLTTGVRTSSWG